MKLSEQMGDVARRLRHLQPHHRDPERFHLERDQLEKDVRRMQRELGRLGDADEARPAPQSR